MKTPIFSNPKFLYAVFILQFIPLLLNPPSVFELTSQKWWLPVLLVLLAIFGSVQVFRRSVEPWPWYLISFAHGFNIISRLMMLLPQSTLGTSFDWLYFLFSLIAMAFSAWMLWLVELPQTRQALAG